VERQGGKKPGREGEKKKKRKLDVGRGSKKIGTPAALP